VVSLIIGLITFVCAFGGAMLGLVLRNILPDHHLSDDSRDTVKMGTGLIATLTALVLGLLVSSAKNTFDSMNTMLTQGGAKIILLDRVLANYGPETKDARVILRANLAAGIQKIWPQDNSRPVEIRTMETVGGMEAVQGKLRMLAPQNDSQHLLQSQALQLSSELLEARWLTIEQAEMSLPTAFLVILLFWLAILFTCIGLFAPPNRTVIVVLLVCAISVAGAIFLMQEMNHPLSGIMKVSGAPLIKALEHLGK
jgi:hypothetical protein